MGTTRRSRNRVFKATLFGAFLALSACAPQFSNHGYIPLQDDLDLVEVGKDTRETVAEKVGVPTSSGVLTNSGYYYVRMRKRAIGPFAPEEVDRQVVAISFSESGVVSSNHFCFYTTRKGNYSIEFAHSCEIGRAHV